MPKGKSTLAVYGKTDSFYLVKKVTTAVSGTAISNTEN